ncbi:hypothetical protein [uncultured Tyzzerella sp.]|nr:hypothetical protein [uncultured Tyzzerella sp.]
MKTNKNSKKMLDILTIIELLQNVSEEKVRDIKNVAIGIAIAK